MRRRRDGDLVLADRVERSGASRLCFMLGVACALSVGSAKAERWTLDPSLGLRGSWTDNGGFEDRSTARAESVLEVSPAISLFGDGKRARLRGTAGFTEVVYLNGTRENRFLPQVDLTGNLEAIERFFFIEAGIVSRQAREEVFGPRPDGSADLNTVTTTQYRLMPSFEGKLPGEVQYRLSSNNSWTDVSGESGSSATGAYLAQHALRIQHAPTPFGWALEATRDDTLFESGLTGRAISDAARLVLPYALSATTRFALRGGYERLQIRTADGIAQEVEQGIYGVDFGWRPSERTELTGLWEDRFFGSGWRLKFDHRMPRVAWSIGAGRDISSFPQSLLNLPPTSNVAALLDAAFTTRIPDAAQRSRVVADLIARQGLPSSLSSQTAIVSQRVSLVTSANASIAILGVRNSLVLGAYRSKTEDLPESLFALVGTGTQNSVQSGGSVSFSHQFTPSAAGNITADFTRVRGVGADSQLASTQKGVRVELTKQLTAKSNAFVGARVQVFSSNVGGSTLASTTSVTIPNDAREHAAYAGLTHRF